MTKKISRTTDQETNSRIESPSKQDHITAHGNHSINDCHAQINRPSDKQSKVLDLMSNDFQQEQLRYQTAILATQLGNKRLQTVTPIVQRGEEETEIAKTPATAMEPPKWKFDIATLKTSGVSLDPFVIGKTIKGKVEVGPVGINSSDGLTLGTKMNQNSIKLIVGKKLTDNVGWKAAGEQSVKGGKVSAKLVFKLIPDFDGLTLEPELAFFEIENGEIQRFALNVSLASSERLIEMNLDNDQRVSLKVRVKLTASVEPDWALIGKLGLRFGANAVKTALRFGAVASPYIASATIVGIPVIVWSGFILYQLSEAQTKGTYWGLSIRYAKGYADALAQIILATQGHGGMSYADANLLLNLDSKTVFEEAVLYSDDYYTSKEAADMAGMAAAVQYIDSLIKKDGLSAWTHWCKGKSANLYKNLLLNQALNHEPIGITLELTDPDVMKNKNMIQPKLNQSELNQSTHFLHELNDRIEYERMRGQPLDVPIQNRMESAIGHDLGNVRIHSTPEANNLNRLINAKAFTTGRDIFFREGAYQPQTSDGQELIAHELTHVVQQSEGRVPADGSGKLTIRPPGDAFEQEADAVARAVTSGRVETGVQRQIDDEDEALQAKPLQRQALEDEEENIQMQSAEEDLHLQRQEVVEEEDELLT